MNYSQKHKIALQREIKRIIKVLKERYQPQKIILYGSMVGGRVNKWSDLDIVVVKDTEKRFYDRIGDVLRVIKPREAVDVLVYTRDEYQRLSKESWFVGEEITKKGRVIYAV